MVLKQAFTPEAAKEWTKDVWVRLGVDSEDRQQWNTISDNLDRIHMPRHNTISADEIAPKAWGAICELLGGEDNIEPKTKFWNDAFIVNLGRDEYKDLDIHPKDLENWHVDGDFFVRTCSSILLIYWKECARVLSHSSNSRCIFWILRNKPCSSYLYSATLNREAGQPTFPPKGWTMLPDTLLRIRKVVIRRDSLSRLARDWTIQLRNTRF